jgi:glycosyltransferase involved in cell wall biosynthesis
MNESIKHHVSIIICHYSLVDDFGETRAVGQKPRSEMLRTTIESLDKNTNYPAEIIVVDNGGNPDDSDYLTDMTRKGIINTYIKNKNNMYFGWAWNQAARLATGDYLCFTCNDIEFAPNWLGTTIKPLLDHPEMKLIATPHITPDKDKPKYMRGELDGYRLNSMAGSNCMLMTREMHETLGELSTHRVASYLWYDKMKGHGILMVAPPVNQAVHLAHRGGVNFFADIKVIKELLNKEVVDFSTLTWRK